jgi:hypothetical protein
MLVTHTTWFDIQFGGYEFLKSCFSSGQIMDRLVCRCCLVRFLGHNEGETSWGLNASSDDNWPGFPMPTQTHVFDNHSNGYSRLSTAPMRSSAGRWNSYWPTVGRSCHGFKWWRLLFLFWLLNLFIMWLDDATCPNCPHQMKRNNSLLWNVRIQWHNTLKYRRQ